MDKSQRLKFMFQFHNGSIKRVLVEKTEALRSESFNSTMVRLKD